MEISALEMVRRTARELRQIREGQILKETELRRHIESFLETEQTTSADFAGEIGVSPQYFSDVRHGRRAISSLIVQRLIGIREEKRRGKRG